MCDRTSRPPTHAGAPTRDGLEDLINQYDEEVSAITRFEDQSSRIFQSDDGDKAWLDVCIAPDSLVGMMRSRIHQTKQLEHLPEFSGAAFFAPPTTNSFSRISPSRNLFDALTTKFSITPRLKEFVMSFGLKRRDVDFGPPTLRFRAVDAETTTESEYDSCDRNDISYECIYSFRYAIHTKDENSGESMWSMRQTAVYHKFDAKEDFDLWILIGASNETKLLIERNIERRFNGIRNSPCLLHAMIIENSLGEWRWYIADLAERVSVMAKKFSLSDISATSPEDRVNISVSFADRQRLKTLEDQILHLRTMLQSTLQTTTSLVLHCSTMNSTQARGGEEKVILNLLTEASQQVDMYLVKADILRKQVKGATTLLTDILTYDNALVLKSLAEEARIDNVAMVRLSEQATEDSRAIRIITIITVVFLPATVVSSFFSTQFVHIELDSFSLSKSTWIYFVVTAVLTLVTIASWIWLPTYLPRLGQYLALSWRRSRNHVGALGV